MGPLEVRREIERSLLFLDRYGSKPEQLKEDIAMGLGLRGQMIGGMVKRDVEAAGGGYYFDEKSTIRFEKKGSEIQGSISKEIESIQKDIEEDQKKVAEICELRGLVLKEVIEADDEEKIEGYRTKAYDNAPQKASAVKELEADLDLLKRFNYRSLALKSRIENLNRVKTNINPDTKFVLTFDELTFFGF
jgi:hypothetical protein